ncbi:MAG: thiamine phosphate synthase [Ruminococcus sp.]|nr:thiamine phosphate synthase [Ruminococcus sp.]MDD5889540.1 thiamine phosphate synthase [Ruminococcus sp.]
MITYMSDIIVITNSSICKEDFLLRIEKLAKAKPKAIVLREKQLSESDYAVLAKKVIEICNKYNTQCILHNFSKVAEKLNHNALHLPLHILATLTDKEKSQYEILGASCHSVEDALKAERLGCTYITAGHTFDTDCKKGLPGRGLDFLKAVCNSVSIPVYAIGGISPENFSMVRNVGANGGCIMSSAMNCTIPQEYLNSFTE